MVGDDAVLTTASPSTVNSIRVYLHVDPMDAVVQSDRFIGTEVYADGKDSDFQNAKNGDTLEMESGNEDGEVFTIINIEPQGNGWTRARLARG